MWITGITWAGGTGIHRVNTVSDNRCMPADFTSPRFIRHSWSLTVTNRCPESTLRIEIALQGARARPKTDLRIIDASAEQTHLRVHIESEANLPEGTRVADLYLAVALNHAESQIGAGENAHRHLTHTSVVRKLTRAAKLKAAERFSRTVELKVDDAADPNNLRVVAFLQDPISGKVVGATMKRVEASNQRQQSPPSFSQSR
jgi:hypothetical protein